MKDTYLIPANSKKSLLFLGIFNKFDLVLFIIGVIISIILVMVLPIGDIVWALIAIAPASIIGFLVFPVPNYHNVMTVIMEAWRFVTSRQKFIWKGWCLRDESDEK